MQPILAKYHNGVFEPVKPIAFTEGQQVTLWLDAGEEVTELRDEDREFFKDLAEKRRTVFQRLAE